MVLSCTIITTDANAVAEKVHNRMPVILATKDYDRWLDPAMTDADELVKLLRPYPARQMEAVAVSTWVNNPRHEGEKCIAKIG